MTDDKKPAEPLDAGALARQFIQAWKDRDWARTVQHEADVEVARMNSVVSGLTLAIGRLLPDDGPRERCLSCEGWTVRLVRTQKGGSVEVTASRDVKTEPV